MTADLRFLEKTKHDCVCATCWGYIDICYLAGEYVLKCMNPDCEGAGFVTKHYADQRRAQNQHERIEVKAMLQSIGVIDNPDAGKTTTQLLKELGI